MMTIMMMMVVIGMMIMKINVLSGMMHMKMKGSKILNKRRALTHCLVSIKILGLVRR